MLMRMQADALPNVFVHQLGQYAIPWILSSKDVIPEESDDDDDETMSSYEGWLKHLSDPSNWEKRKKGAKKSAAA